MTDRWLTSSQQQSWRSLLLGVTLLLDRLDRDLRERHNLSLAEYEILVRLSESTGHEMRMAELANSVKNSRSRITHTVKRLEENGYVVRRACESDGRGVLAALTETGYARLVAAAPDHVDSVRDSLIDVMSSEDLAVIGRAFGQVAAALEACAPPPVDCPESA